MRTLFIAVLFLTSSLFSQETESISREELAKKIGLTLPIKEANKSLEELSSELKSKAEKEIEKQFPPKSKDSFAEEVISKYPLHKVGDSVIINVRYRGALKEAKGKFTKITSSSLYIGSQSYPLVDIDSKVASQFDPVKWKNEVEKEAEKKFKKYESERRYGLEDYLKKHREAFYNDNGYSIVRGEWIKSSEFLQMAIDKVEAEKKAAREKITKAKKKKKETVQTKPKSESEGQSDSKAGLYLVIGIYIIMCLNSLAMLFAIYFEDGILWLLGTLFIPFVGLILLVRGWQSYKKFFFVHIILLAILLTLIFVVGIKPSFD